MFVVEDEHWALAELTALFEVYKPEHRILSFASGEEALAAAGVTIPQLVVTDINMPGMDGLALIRELNRTNTFIKSIILSGHDQFEYARQGVEIGILDYLLKPVKKDGLYKSINKAIALIESDHRQHEERMNWMISQLLLASAVQDNEISRNFYQSRFMIVLLLLENWSSLRSWDETGIQNGDLTKQLVYGPISEKEIYCVDIDAKRKVILIPILVHASSSKIEFCLHNMFTKFNEKVQLSYGMKREQEKLNKWFMILNQQIELHSKLESSAFIASSAQNIDRDLSGVWEKVRIVETLFMQGDIRSGREMLHRIMVELQMKEITIRQLQSFINDVLYSLQYKLLASRKLQAAAHEFHKVPAILTEISTYQELTDWLYDTLLALYRNPERPHMKPKRLIPLLMHWIHTHYDQEICLQHFAADNHVSLGYLSKLFKAQTGGNFSDYLIRYRIGKAKELLAGGMERLADVSILVGYEDPKHFSHLFKKIVGESPHAYAKRMK